MRIAVIGPRGFPDIAGGVERHCQNLYPRIVARGNEVVVFARQPYLGARVREFGGVKLVPIPCPRRKHTEAILYASRALLPARKIGPDILHIHAVGPALVTPLARLLGLRVVFTSHGPDYLRQKWGSFAKRGLKAGEAMGVRFADEVIAISKSVKAMLSERYGRPDLKFIPNGITLPELLPPGEVLESYELEPKKYVFTATRFVPEKGLGDLMAAFGKISNPGFKLVIAGGAEHEGEYSRAIKGAAGRDSGIVLTGFVSGERLGELYSNAGLFVLPSYYEGMPIALLEALSYGLPVLVSDIPAHREIPLPPFRYFPPGNRGALSRQMVLLWQRGISEKERKQQQELLARDYDWDSIAGQTCAVYQKVLANE